jgi:hypothetical protein
MEGGSVCDGLVHVRWRRPLLPFLSVDVAGRATIGCWAPVVVVVNGEVASKLVRDENTYKL